MSMIGLAPLNALDKVSLLGDVMAGPELNAMTAIHMPNFFMPFLLFS
jgi:hypothetical protein